MPQFDLTGQTTRALPGSDYLKQVKGFLGLGEDDDPGADTPVVAAALRSQRTAEAQNQFAADPRNPSLASRALRLQTEESLDPYSETNTEARNMAGQSAADVVSRFMHPGAVAMRHQQAKELGEQALNKAQGTALGGTEAAITPEADLLRRRELEQKQKESYIQRFLQGYGSSPEPSSAGSGEGADGVPTQVPRDFFKGDTRALATLDAMHQGSKLVGTLKAMLDRPTSEDGNVLSNSLGYFLYQRGVAPETIQSVPGIGAKAAARIQLAGLIRPLLSSPFSVGSRSFQFMKIAMEHLTNPASSDALLREQVNNLEQMYPEMQRDLIKFHMNPATPLDFSPISGFSGGQ